LSGSTSPYLEQHAGNPVDWYPWGDEALRRAREEDRPILLSIGYSACHWCHVMARESFEDPDTAALMNRLFVNVKVDREERPDLDRVYQTAHQLLSGRPGGWPLTVFLAPDQTPFFAGTYFPARPIHGMPAFRQVLEQIDEAWRSQRDAIREQNASLREALANVENGPPGGAVPPAETIDAARTALAGRFDANVGGFGDAPKFPQPTVLNRLLRHYAMTARSGQPDREALHMACHTLRRMALGGIYDQVGGGFCRYSVDRYWMIPHFEKMLGDNGLLLAVFTDAWRATGDALYRRIARETAEWLLREMRHPEGGFFTALDADSKDGEGAFYLWTPEAVRSVLDEDAAELTELRFGLDERPNFEGRWHLHVHMTFSELAKRLRRPRAELVSQWTRARRALREARDTRPRPARDEKVLTAWNALVVTGLARTGRLLGEPPLVDAAATTLDFLHRALWRDGRLLASWRDGTARLPAYLDDHALLLEALLEQLQSRWDARWLFWAEALAELLITRFQDDDGAFRMTADDAEPLIHRPRPLADDAMPAGNGVAARVLARLGHLLGETRYLEAAERALAAASGAISHAPDAHASLVDALEEYHHPPETVLIKPPAAAEPADWLDAAEARYAPNRQVFVLPGETTAVGAITLTGSGAWICRGLRCLPPVGSPQALADALEHPE